jgi:tetratricopeptide (TPR) repeat protein
MGEREREGMNGLASQLWPLLDFGSYGLKDWLLLLAGVLAIAGYAFGLWQARRYSQGQIAYRLLEYLEGEASTIKHARAAIIRHLRYGEPMPEGIDHPFFRTFGQALAELDRGETARAEQRLTELSKIGGKYVTNASLQTATALLVLGRIALARSDNAGAKSAWETALKFNPDDAEAARHLGELSLAMGDADAAWEEFARAAELDPEDRLAKAETTEMRARYYRERRNPKLELGALNQCAPNFARAGAYDRAAAAYARAGEISAELGNPVQAPISLKRAFDNYKLAGNGTGMAAMREGLERLGEDVSELPVFIPRTARMPSMGIRLAVALPILAAVAYLLYTLSRATLQ